VAELSRDISHGLDDAESAAGEFIAGEYQLEVSSPGTDAPLTSRVTGGGMSAAGQVQARRSPGDRGD